jgi:hypothetical protein
MTRRAYVLSWLSVVIVTLAVRAPAQDDRPATPAAPAATTPARPVTWALRLSRDGQVLWNSGLPDMAALREGVLRAAWTSDAGKTAMRDLGLTEQQARESLEFSALPGSRNVGIILTLPRDGPEVRRAATTFLDALAGKVVLAELRNVVTQAYDQQLARHAEAVAAAAQRVAEASGEATKLRRSIRDASQVLDPSPDAVRGAASRLDQERQKITLELAGQAARQRALEERVAKLSDAAAARVDKDEIAAELEKIVKLREREAALHEELKRRGGDSEAAVGAAQVQVAEARARLLERREAAARAAGTDLLGDLNKELVTLTITIAENQARLKYVEQRLDGLGRALELADGLEQAIAATARARRSAEAAEGVLEQFRARVAARPDLGAAVSWNDLSLELPGSPKLFGR